MPFHVVALYTIGTAIAEASAKVALGKVYGSIRQVSIPELWRLGGEIKDSNFAVTEAISALPGIIGAFAVGTFASLVLYGISILQFYRYLRTHPDDNIHIKVLVFSAVLLNTVHTIMSMHICYYYLVSNYFSPAALARSVWSSDLLPVAHLFVTMVSQAFFARRVYLIGARYKFIAIFAVSILTSDLRGRSRCAKFMIVYLPLRQPSGEYMYVSFRISIVCLRSGGHISDIAYQGLSLNVLLITLPHGQLNMSLSLGLSALADIVLSGAIIVSLRRDRGSHASLSIFDLAVLYVLNTGVLTGFVVHPHQEKPNSLF
ncbi:hypothetical protein C8Q78DRAFT_1147327, partial [Trametes maxima]